jgi:hypothetical protein
MAKWDTIGKESFRPDAAVPNECYNNKYHNNNFISALINGHTIALLKNGLLPQSPPFFLPFFATSL